MEYLEFIETIIRSRSALECMQIPPEQIIKVIQDKFPGKTKSDILYDLRMFNILVPLFNVIALANK